MIIYCPSCAAKIEYTLNKPSTCPKCKKTTAIKVEISASNIFANSPNTIHTVRKPVKPAPRRALENEDDYYEDEVEDLKNQLVASLGGKMATTEITKREAFTFGELVNNPGLAE